MAMLRTPPKTVPALSSALDKGAAAGGDVHSENKVETDLTKAGALDPSVLELLRAEAMGISMKDTNRKDGDTESDVDDPSSKAFTKMMNMTCKIGTSLDSDCKPDPTDKQDVPVLKPLADKVQLKFSLHTEPLDRIKSSVIMTALGEGKTFLSGVFHSAGADYCDNYSGGSHSGKGKAAAKQDDSKAKFSLKEGHLFYPRSAGNYDEYDDGNSQKPGGKSGKARGRGKRKGGGRGQACKGGQPKAGKDTGDSRFTPYLPLFFFPPPYFDFL